MLGRSAGVADRFACGRRGRAHCAESLGCGWRAGQQRFESGYQHRGGCDCAERHPRLLDCCLAARSVSQDPGSDANSGEIHRPADRLAQIARAAEGRSPQAHVRQDLAGPQDRGPGSGGEVSDSLPTLAVRALDRRDGVVNHQRRRQLSGWRGGAEIPAQRGHVADLHRAENPGRLRQSRGSDDDRRVGFDRTDGGRRAEVQLVAVPAHSPEFVDPGHVHQRRPRVGAPEPAVDHQVGAAGDDHRARIGGQDRHGLARRPRPVVAGHRAFTSRTSCGRLSTWERSPVSIHRRSFQGRIG